MGGGSSSYVQRPVYRRPLYVSPTVRSFTRAFLNNFRFIDTDYATIARRVGSVRPCVINTYAIIGSGRRFEVTVYRPRRVHVFVNSPLIRPAVVVFLDVNVDGRV